MLQLRLPDHSYKEIRVQMESQERKKMMLLATNNAIIGRNTDMGRILFLSSLLVSIAGEINPYTSFIITGMEIMISD